MAPAPSVERDPEWFSQREVMAWLQRRRWYAGKSREGTATLRQIAQLPDTQPVTAIWFADITYADGAVERYHVPLVASPDRPDAYADALSGLGDNHVWLRGIAAGGTAGPLSCARTAGADEIPVNALARPMGAQQSNTSIVFGDQAVLKVYRRIEPGLNPDIEIHDALTRIGDQHTARLLGHVSVDVDGHTYSLAMLQQYLPDVSDGWDLATASVRSSADFTAQAQNLGQATAEVHSDLARAFGASTATAQALARQADTMHARLDAALAEVPALAALETSLRHNFDALRTLDSLTVHRIHGDLHLGQVVHSGGRWVFLDFEGEPTKTLDERRAPDSPLRDVAGMLRSFDYAAHHQLIDDSAASGDGATQWARTCRDAYCAGYAEASGLDLTEHLIALTAYESDKAVYEAVYETRSRPEWLPIPLASLHRLAPSEA